MQTTRIKRTFIIFVIVFGLFLLAACKLFSSNVIADDGSTPTLTVLPGTVGLPKLMETPPTSRCEPITASNDSGYAILTMADGSQAYLGNDTEIEIMPSGYCTGSNEHQIMILKGEVAVHSLAPAWTAFVIKSPNGEIANIGVAGLVTYDPVEQTFSLQCSNVNCSIGTDTTTLVSLECGQTSGLDANGNSTGLSFVDTNFLALFGDWLIPQCAVPTLTPNPEDVSTQIAATSTAFCDAFSKEFLSTPCPTMAIP